MVEITKINKPLGELLLSSRSKQDDRASVKDLRDLLERALELDPAKRLTPKDALQHQFFGEKQKPQHNNA